MLLVTGGAGFIGSNFVRRWISSTTEDIVNLDALKHAGAGDVIADFALASSYSFVEGDITNPELMKDVFNTYRPRAVVHFAAESHVDKSIDSPRSFLESNVMGTFELLNASVAYKKKFGVDEFRFIHISTDEVFGTLEPEDDSFTEESNYKPNSAYSASKAASDHLVRAWYHTYQLPTLITNCSNNYGPFQYPEKLIPLVISKALSGDRIPVYGDGQQVRDWLHVHDHCDAIVAVLNNGTVGETYNIGGNSELANLVVVEMLCEALDESQPSPSGRSYKDQIDFVADRPGHDRRYSINFSKIEKSLDWSPAIPFSTGIEDTVRWYLENQDWLKTNEHATQRQGLVS